MGTNAGPRRRVGAAVLVAVLAMVMASGACGSSSTETGSGGGGSSSTSAPTTTTAPPGSTVPAGAVDIVVIATPYGDALGTDDGLVLYAWDAEADGTIACLDADCVEKWPPLLAAEVGDVGDLDPTRVTLVERPDGTTQVAIDGRPLYHMAVDEPGEATCQGAEGWWILNPDGTTNVNETPRSAGSATTTTTASVEVGGY